jgi:hypothetical protein
MIYATIAAHSSKTRGQYAQNLLLGIKTLPSSENGHVNTSSSSSRLGLMACSDSDLNFSEFMNLWIFGRAPWRGDQPHARPLPTRRTTQHRKTRTHIHASSGIPVFERPKTVRASNRAAIGTQRSYFVWVSIFEIWGFHIGEDSSDTV